MANHVEHFYQTGKLLDGTYYFDPPLIEPEIRELHNILGHIRGNKVILNPITVKTIESRTLLWLDVSHNIITGWQNVDDADDDQGEYVLNNLSSIQRWCAGENSCYEPFRNGRLFLAELPNTEDIFNQLNESDDFDWVPKFTDPSKLKNMDLVEFLKRYFKNAGYDYRSDYDGDYYNIYDGTGIYVHIKDDETFSLDSLKKTILNSITRMKSRGSKPGKSDVYYETIQEYQELYQALEPLFK